MMTPSRGMSDANLCFGALFSCKLLVFFMDLRAQWRNHDWFTVCNISPFQFVGDEKTRSFLVSLVRQLLYVLSTRLEYECSYEAMGQLATVRPCLVELP
jgi:hypothetical protein